MTRRMAGMIAALAFVLVAGLAQAFESKTDRPGSDYRNFEIVAPAGGTIVSSAAMCENHCIKDFKCVAWTLVDRGVQGPNARCWLKNQIPAPRSCPHCTSGAFKQRAINKAF